MRDENPNAMEGPGVSASRGRAWSAVTFAILYVGGVIPLGELLGSFADSDETFVAYFATDSNRVGVLIGGLVLALAAVAFLWFVANIRAALEGPGALPHVVSGAGVAFACLLAAGAAAAVTVPYARIFGGALDTESILVGSDALLPQLAYVLITVMAMWMAAALILAVSLAARARGLFPRWLVQLGFGAAIFVFLLGPSVMGVLGLPVWALAVAVFWFRASSPVSPVA